MAVSATVVEREVSGDYVFDLQIKEFRRFEEYHGQEVVVKGIPLPIRSANGGSLQLLAKTGTGAISTMGGPRISLDAELRWYKEARVETILFGKCRLFAVDDDGQASVATAGRIFVFC